VTGGMGRGVHELLSSLRWLVVIPVAALVYGLLYGVGRLGRSPEERHALRGRLLCRFLVACGPLAIKAGQVLATHSGLLADTTLRELRRLHDDVPPLSRRAARAVVERAYGAPVGQVFAEWSLDPLASASIAQVHRARLPSGEAVAVKVVRPGVRLAVRRGLSALALVARAVHASVPPVRQLNLPGHLEELAPILLGQTDMLAELERLEKVAANFMGHPYVRVPRAHRAFARRDLLVMELVEGIRGNEAHAVRLSSSRLARRLQDAFYTMVYFHGFFQVDPHPGNIHFSAGGEIIVLDFGIIGTLQEEEKLALSAFYYACVRQEWKLAIDRFVRHFTVDPGVFDLDRDRVERELAEVLERHFAQRRDRWSTMGFVHDANVVVRRHRGRLTTAFTQVALAMLTGENFISAVDPEIDVWENARRFTDRASPYLSEAVRRHFDRIFGEDAPGSFVLRERAAKSLVASTHLDRFVLPSAFPLFVESARGCWIEDVDGNRYIDLSCGLGPHLLGYDHPAIRASIEEALGRGATNAIGHRGEVELAEEITSALPGADLLVFANSGTESVLQALRICRGYRGRSAIAKFEGHYHGFSDQGCVSSWFRFSGSRAVPRPKAPSLGSHEDVVERTLVLQYGDPTSLGRLRAHADDLACVICEPMPLSLASVDEDFLRQLRQLCSELNLPLVFDEVVTGFRVDFGGVQTLSGIAPDLTCLGKVIGGGLPCGAVAGRRDLVSVARSSGDPFVDMEQRVFVGGTMSGNSLSCAAGLGALRHLRAHPEIYTHVDRRSRDLGRRLGSRAEARGIPLFVGAGHSFLTLTFDYRKPRLVRDQHSGSDFRASLALAYYLRNNGVYVPELHVVFLSAAHGEAELDAIDRAFAQSLDEMIADGLFVQ